MIALRWGTRCLAQPAAAELKKSDNKKIDFFAAAMRACYSMRALLSVASPWIS
jgi:hypothetical protein